MDDKDTTGQAYESLTQAIFQTILDQDAAQNIHVERDVQLKGKSTSHQIDVYWKFVLGGLTYETIVEAKDWNKRVDQGKLLAFKTVLDDLPGQPKGIFVTRTGYQGGAKDVAAFYGIILYELDQVPSGGHNITMKVGGWATVNFKVLELIPPQDVVEPSDPDCGSHNLPLQAPATLGQQQPRRENAFGRQYTIFDPEYSNLTFYLDKSWAEEHVGAERMQRPLLELTPFPENVPFYDDQQSEVANLQEILRDASLAMQQENVFQKHFVHSFAHPTFLGAPVTTLPRLKVTGISVDIHIRTRQTPYLFTFPELSNFVQFVLRRIGGDSPDALTFIRSRNATALGQSDVSPPFREAHTYEPVRQKPRGPGRVKE
jgi:hypothetical protein